MVVTGREELNWGAERISCSVSCGSQAVNEERIDEMLAVTGQDVDNGKIN